MAASKDPGLAIRYEVKVDGVDLGAFTECDGLAGEYEVLEYPEGGNNTFVHRLPGRMKHTNVTLKRPIDAESGKLAAWFSSLRDAVSRKTASITVYDGNKKKIAGWSLVGVWPAKYSGPKLSSTDEGVAIETLELVHDGFTHEGG